MINQGRIICAVALTLGCAIPTHAKVWSKLSVNVESTPQNLEGTYISVTSDQNTNNFVTSSTSLTQSSGGTFYLGNDTHTYYLKVNIAPEDADKVFFLGWYAGDQLLSQDYQYTHYLYPGGGNGTEGLSKKQTIEARFETSVILGSNPQGASSTISALKNGGEPLTLQSDATVTWNGVNMPNLSMVFDGWVNTEGELLSMDNPYTFIPEAGVHGLVVSPRYVNVTEQPQAGKYYRIRNAANRVLTIEGNYKNEITLGHWTKDETVDATILRWALASDHNHEVFGNIMYADTDDAPGVEVEAAPETIFYMTGSSSSANFAAQGTDTKAIFNRDFEIHDVGDDMPGYYYLKTGAATQAGLRTKHMADACYLERGGVSEAKDKISAAMIFQPIDEQHIDQYWFGVTPDESLVYDGDYWTTMYTAFPYKCLDDVEAYYVTEARDDEVNFACLKKIDTGIVPANTAVMLRCKSLNSKENRLLPIAPDTQIQPIEGNLLIGAFQLNIDSNGSGHTSKEDTMYGLSLNDAGCVSFCAERTRAAGELERNRAYLNVAHKAENGIPGGYYQIITEEILTGIHGVSGAEIDMDVEKLYDLSGHRVMAPQSGHIYIYKGHKLIWQ